ncbi:MAG: hypothetical protein HY728_02650 [Candidatus Rokubacteria bacterium]|nr:hypothetical protein [Candidatus Rokubacteria bacterium]MBI4593090.1 hypothetical protein [Candidatus Rokubacteria bacterium]
MPPPVTDDAFKILLALRESAADGYGLLSKTRLDPKALAKALGELLAQKIVIVKGELDPERIGETYVSVRPSARGFADLMVQYKDQA